MQAFGKVDSLWATLVRDGASTESRCMDFKTPNTLAEQIAHYLANQLVTGKIPPGKRLQEAVIATDLGVSRASVKEALYTLERWHLVQITPRKGASVSQLDTFHASELYAVYVHLLVMLTRLLCERWREDDLAVIQARVDELLACAETPLWPMGGIIQSAFDVMDACCDLVDNPYLTEALCNFRPAVGRLYLMTSDRRPLGLDTARNFFSGLGRSVIKRDADAAQAQIIRFAEHQKRLILQELASGRAAG